MGLTAVLVSFNSRDLLCRAVRSCLGSTTPMRIVVVDNGSTDGSADAVESMSESVQVIRAEENLGFAAATNLGAAAAPLDDDILLVNPDAVLDPDAVEHLSTAAAAEPWRGIYGALVLLEDGSVDPGYAKQLPTLRSLFCFATGLSSLGRGSRLLDPESLIRRVPTGTTSVGMVSGCVVLISAEAWHALRGFDERYFLYAEDADLSSRARSGGFSPSVVPMARAHHVSGGTAATSAIRQQLMLCGRVTYLRHHWPPGRARAGVVLLTLGVGLRALASGALALARRQAVEGRWVESFRQRDRWRDGYLGAGPPPWLAEAAESRQDRGGIEVAATRGDHE